MRTITLAIAMLLCGCARQDSGNAADEVAQVETQAPAEDRGVSADGATPGAATAANDGETKAGGGTDTGTSPCLVQDGKPIPDNRLRAVGTEPFWGAAIEGRCVTYSTPEEQAGTRVWTKFEGSAANGRWSGALRGAPFVLTTREQSGCSDGMSDRRFPIAVELKVGGELRRGCAERR